jgi:hypothetical protein
MACSVPGSLCPGACSIAVWSPEQDRTTGRDIAEPGQKTHTFGSMAVLGQTLNMSTPEISHVPYAELPVKARAMLFIFALAAAARYMTHPPTRLELTQLLEFIWNRHRLGINDLSNPFHMTALLEKHLSTDIGTRSVGSA